MRTQEGRYFISRRVLGKSSRTGPSFIHYAYSTNYLFHALVFCFFSSETNPIYFDFRVNYYTVAQLVEHRAAMP